MFRIEFDLELHLYWLLLWSLNCKKHAGTGIFWQESDEVRFDNSTTEAVAKCSETGLAGLSNIIG